MASLESDLDSYRVVSNPESDESERVATLQHSLSVHEVGLASLKTEYDRQAIELHQAEEEVSKLRDTLAKKVGYISVIIIVYLAAKAVQLVIFSEFLKFCDYYL